MHVVTTSKSVFVKLIAFILLLNFFCLTVSTQTPSWTATGNLNAARFHHTATLLTNGKVLVIGGFGRCSFPAGCMELASAELYDPATGTWSATGGLRTMQGPHLAIRLLSGKVLAVGSSRTNPMLSSAELYDPETGTWSVTGGPRVNAVLPVPVLLPNGKVLLAGGAVTTGGGFAVLNTAELYDPASGTWSATGNLNVARAFHSATLLANGKVLVAGGNSCLGVVAFADHTRGR
jgi:hypothetical protein